MNNNWNGKEEEQNVKLPETNNVLDNALVVVSNLIARATTKWSVEETKLFMCFLSQIKTRDEDGWVRLSKQDVIQYLEYATENGSSWLRQKIKSVMKKSFIQIDGETEEEWDDGFLITRVRSDRYNLYVKFEKSYLPLLDGLANHFTEFYLDYVKEFKYLSSFKLYVYLLSCSNPDYSYKNWKIRKKDIPKVFGLKDSDYWRNYGKENARFHWSDFEKNILKPAISEINDLNAKGKCDMQIIEWKKMKKGRFVLGYDIMFCFTEKDGFLKVSEEGWQENVSEPSLPFDFE